MPNESALHFVVDDGPEPHRERTKQLLAAHPGAKDLQGPEPWSAAIALAVVALQLGLAWVLRGSSPWLALLVAYLVGAVAVHALWVLIHEAAHNLIFQPPWANKATSIVANLPILFPSAIAFRRYHLLHHAWQGDPEIDADLPSPAEARLVKNSGWRKALWLLFYFAVQGLRATRLKRIQLWEPWYVVNVAVQVLFIVAVVHVAGWTSLLYLFLSSAFAIGLHPLGARWIQEHYLTFPGRQETFSYYGAANAVALNVGYHNEHHDLMRVPWSRLPALHRMAPELYDGLHSHRSWTKLLWRFLSDPSISLYSRVIRHGTAPEEHPQPVA
ncbi:MAG TPA: fatty acid desaturase [Anaeromyxobacteraceae bacterium]|nr:fatty acid desaturase [Anaeromyxobacteraceae bacterium]